MFGNENIGQAVKSTAKILFFVLFVGSVAGGIALLANGMTGQGIGLIAGGTVVSYLLCFFIHSFGYLIEKTEKIEKELEREKKEKERLVKESEEKAPSGYMDTDIKDKDKIDEILSLRKAGVIDEEECNRRLAELMK